MGRWIRGPGTGDPRDSWKEKREAWARGVMEGGWRGVPQPGPLTLPQVSRRTSPGALGNRGN